MAASNWECASVPSRRMIKRTSELRDAQLPLAGYPAEDMDCYRVSKLVNDAKND